MLRYDEHWVPPWRTKTQVMCAAGADCHLLPPALVIASTTVQGFCVGCAKKRGIRAVDDDGPGTVQSRLPGPWDA